MSALSALCIRCVLVRRHLQPFRGRNWARCVEANLARCLRCRYDRSGDDTAIKYVSGSVEVACALGLADGVVDLVETGTTMRAAGLEIISTIMQVSGSRSQPFLSQTAN